MDWEKRKHDMEALFARMLKEAQRNWRLLVGAALAVLAVAAAVEVSDRQGRLDLPRGYAVRMTCEHDPESALWSGGCERVAADIARTDKPSFIGLYRAFLTAHHRRIPSSQARRAFARQACEDGFDLDKALQGTRYVFVPLRQHFAGTCARAQAETVMAELDERDRALLTIERAGLSHAALYAGALANLSEPIVIFAAAAVLAALYIL